MTKKASRPAPRRNGHKPTTTTTPTTTARERRESEAIPHHVPTRAALDNPRRRADDRERQEMVDRISTAAIDLAFGEHADSLGMLEAQAKMLEWRIDFNREAAENWAALTDEDKAAFSRAVRHAE